MNDHELQAIGRAFDRFSVAGPVLDVGSRDINGTIHPILPDGVSYVGVDHEHGPNVSVRVCHALPFADDTFGAVVCNSTLEHDPFFWLAIAEMYRVARPGAALVLGVPSFDIPYHAYPVDAYRFTEAALEACLVGCSDVVVERFGPANRKRLCASGLVSGPWAGAA